MCTSKPSSPSIPAPPPPPTDSNEVSDEAKRARDEAKAEARRSSGRKSTFLTSPKGIETEARTARKTLLGE